MNYILKINCEDIEYIAALENEYIDKVEELDAENVLADLENMDDDFAELKKKFNPVFEKGVFTFIPEPVGYFGKRGCLEAFRKAMYAASNYFEIKASKLSVKIETEDVEHEIPGLEKAIVNMLVQDNEIDSWFDQNRKGNWTAIVAAGCLNKFLKNGNWERAMINENDEIIQNTREWPDMQKDAAGKAKWIKNGKEYKPIIYFNDSNYGAINCWSLCEDNESWKSFWFGEKGLLDWKQLGLDENSISFMNQNESIIKPALAEIREACPIKLDKNDTQAQLMEKIEQNFVKFEFIIQSALKMVEMSKANGEG